MRTILIDRADEIVPCKRAWRSGVQSLGLIVLVAAAALAFGWPTRNGDFLSGDDHGLVLEHVFVNHPSLSHAWKLLTMVHGDLYQPLPMLSFQLNYALAGADAAGRFAVSPRVFHLTNILLHMVNASLACLIALRLARRSRTERHAAPGRHDPALISNPQSSIVNRQSSIALLTGLMFACHPLAQEPVAWITGRMILMSTCFSLALILLCLHRRDDGRGAWPVLAGVSWLLALLSKVLPSVPAAAAWCDYQSGRRVPRRVWAVYAVLLAVSGIATYLAIASTQQVGLIEITQAEMTTSTPVRMLLASRYYFENYVWPTRMSAWSPPPHNVPFLSGATGVALLEWALLLALAAAAWRYNRAAFTGIVLFVVLIAPFLAATAARKFLTADRYMYLPMIGLHLAAAAAVVQLGAFLRRRLSARPAVAAVGLPCAALLAVWMTIGWRQAAVWANTVTQGLRAMEVYPDDVQVRAELAKAYIFQKNPDAALKVITEARRRWRKNPRLASEAGEAHRLKQAWRPAEAELRYAVKHMPQNQRTRYYLGLTLERLGRIEEARACYRTILEQRDNFLPAVTALARSYRATGEIDAAIETFQRAVALNPYHRDSQFELALLYMRRDEWEPARRLLASIVEIDPGDGPALLNLGAALARLGRSGEALAVYDRLPRGDPSVLTGRINRAALLATLGRTAEAEAEYREILSTQPDRRDAVIGLHELLQESGRYAELVPLWEGYSKVGGNEVETRAWMTWALVLDGRTQEAAAEASAIPADSAARPFVRWALAYDPLRSGDGNAFRERLGPPIPAGPVTTARREQARIIRIALTALPEEIRLTPAGYYALARALAFDGNVAMARAAVEQIPATALPEGWSEAVADLAEMLGAQRTQPASRPAKSLSR